MSMQFVTGGSEPLGQHACVAKLQLSTPAVVLQNTATFNVMDFFLAPDVTIVEESCVICIR